MNLSSTLVPNKNELSNQYEILDIDGNIICTGKKGNQVNEIQYEVNKKLLLFLEEEKIQHNLKQGDYFNYDTLKKVINI